MSVYHFTKKWLEKICRKNNHNHIRSNNYVVCIAAVLCILNILDVMVFENIYHLQILKMKWEEKILQSAYIL
jgi:hypothetical protein